MEDKEDEFLQKLSLIVIAAALFSVALPLAAAVLFMEGIIHC